MLAEIGGDGGVVFCADLIPGRPWVHLPITMGYDRYPELLIDEKRRFLEDKIERRVRLSSRTTWSAPSRPRCGATTSASVLRESCAHSTARSCNRMALTVPYGGSDSCSRVGALGPTRFSGEKTCLT